MPSAPSRRKIPEATQVAILVKSRRRCCLCYGLAGDTSLKQGQIAHIDRDRANPKENNLAFLCLTHHDQYDGNTSQSKNFTAGEVRHYRDELYARIGEDIERQLRDN